MAFGTLFYAAVAVFQYRMMREQAETTKAQLKAMQEQSSTIQGQLNVMQDQANSMRDSVSQQRKSVGQTETLIDQQQEALSYGQRSALASEQGVRQGRDALRLEQRPIVTVTWMRLKSDVKVGEKATIIIAIKNTGRTPAIKTRWLRTLGFGRGQEPPFVPPMVFDEQPSLAVLSPEVEISNELLSDHPVTSDEMERLVAEHYRLFAWGTLTYEDLFGRKYKTEFCAFNRTLKTGETGKFFACPRGETFE